MTAYDYAFAFAILLLFATEFLALARDHDQTLTHKVIHWMKRKRTWWRRFMVIFFIVWLLWHFGWQFFN